MTRTLLLGALLCTTLASNSWAQEGGIEVFAAETLFTSGTRVSVGHVYRSRGSLFLGDNEISDPLNQTLTEHRVVTSIAHGVRRGLTLSALFPVVRRELDSNAGDIQNSGLGDVAILAKYRAYKRDWKRGAMHLSLIGGLELPTGDTSARAAGARLAPSLQTGSGAWNPFAGVSMNASFNRYRFDAIGFYKLNNEGAQGLEAGDFFSLEADMAYRFLHTKYPGPTASAKLGMQYRHSGRAELEGAEVSNSGSDELFLRSGLTWHPAPQWDVTLALDVPLHQDFRGQQLGLDYRTFFAIGLRF